MINIYLKTTYDSDFEDLIMHLRSKYKHEIFDMEGIGKQTDMSTFSKNFFNSKTTVADVSVDSNSNVDDMSVIAYNVELPKPFFRLNSLYLTWKYLKQLYGHPIANKAIEMQISGDIYINDFSGINFPYSYYDKTIIVIKENGNIIYTTMKDLFERYSKNNNINILEDRKIINLNGIKILDKDNKWINLKCILKHKSHTNLIKIETKNGFSTIVTTDHPVILEDGSEKYANELSINDGLMISNTCVPFIEDKNVDDNYAYMVGFMIGDGWLYKSKGVNADIISGNITIRQKDIQTTKIFKVVSNLYDNVKSYEEDKITFGYKKDVENLLDTGIGSINRKLPIDILHWNKSAIKSLLSGIIDSDGNINNQNGMVTIRVISYEMVQQIGEILRALNVGCVRTSFAGVYNSVSGYKSENDVFRVSIRLENKDFINYSEKINDNENLVYKEMKKDGRYETNKINKLEQWITPEYVYDVTTETGHFHCQGLIQHNCYNFSSYDVMTLGLPFVKKVTSEPAKHLSSFMGQLIHFSVYASNSVLGAVGLADVLIVASYYVDKLFNDNPNISSHYLWKQVKQELQSFVFSCNQPFRGGVQSGFYNVSIFDEDFLEKMCSEYIFPDGSTPNKNTINKLQEIYINLMNETLRSTPITFPVTTACFSVDENKNIKDKKFLNFIAKNNLEFGFINLYFGETSTLSSCCRLRSSIKNEYFNQFGAGGTKIGSLGVVTMNIPRMAINANKDRNKFFEILTEVTEMVIRINNTKRTLLKKRITTDSLPLYKLGFMSLETQYCTTGVVGLNEACEIMGYNILKKDGQGFVSAILNTINNINDKASKKYNAPFNMEQTPSENSAIKMANKDKLLGLQDEYDLYSNQFIPLTVNADLLDRIKLQGLFDSKMSGGAICHLNIENRIEDEKLIENLITISAKAGVVYTAINYNLQRCINGHMTIGKNDKCSICGSEITDNYTRVVGFLVNTKNFHKIRRDVDYPNRIFYDKLDVIQ